MIILAIQFGSRVAVMLAYFANVLFPRLFDIPAEMST
jgi:hypothetical protein